MKDTKTEASPRELLEFFIIIIVRIIIEQEDFSRKITSQVVQVPHGTEVSQKRPKIELAVA